MQTTTRAVLLALAMAAAPGIPGPAAAEIAATADEIRPVLVGTTLPDARIRTVEGKVTTLRQAAAGEPGILIVYRGGWCPVCSGQFQSLGPVLADLRETGVELYAMSADAPERLLPGHGGESPYTLLSDHDLHAARALGLAFHVSDDYVRLLEQYGLDTEGNAVATAQVLPVPAVFVFDAEGTITFSYVNPNYKVRCDPDVLLAAARAVTRD